MTKSGQTQSLIIGSYIIYLTGLLTKKERFNGSTVSLSQYVYSKTRKPNNFKKSALEEVVKVADKGWTNVLESFRDDDLKIAIALVIETLYFNHEDILTSFYGQELGNRIVRFSNKQSYDGISEYARDSYIVADALSKSVQKSVFEYLKD